MAVLFLAEILMSIRYDANDILIWRRARDIVMIVTPRGTQKVRIGSLLTDYQQTLPNNYPLKAHILVAAIKTSTSQRL
ncbi:2730_t:CDS:2 [Funneliformis mosseae]|uniref:2730_t:CDS:1 n=1 Tax=Funneliformis mosseae TaxID=27381 RepID=A0A9N9GTI9_FUNMO|nr:2730_t:CDS:2 [Funneliformis mosseae]